MCVCGGGVVVAVPTPLEVLVVIEYGYSSEKRHAKPHVGVTRAICVSRLVVHKI